MVRRSAIARHRPRQPHLRSGEGLCTLAGDAGDGAGLGVKGQLDFLFKSVYLHNSFDKTALDALHFRV